MNKIVQINTISFIAFGVFASLLIYVESSMLYIQPIHMMVTTLIYALIFLVDPIIYLIIFMICLPLSDGKKVTITHIISESLACLAIVEYVLGVFKDMNSLIMIFVHIFLMMSANITIYWISATMILYDNELPPEIVEAQPRAEPSS